MDEVATLGSKAVVRPHRLWLALLATRLSRELVKTLNGKVVRAGEFETCAVTIKRAARSVPLLLLSRFLVAWRGGGGAGGGLSLSGPGAAAWCDALLSHLHVERCDALIELGL